MSDDVVLLVEDHAATGEMVQMVLEAELGLRTMLARDGREALALLQETEPVLVILDVVLPEVDGLAVLRQLKADPATRPIPVIAVTGMRKGCEEAIAAGCLSCLDKPFDLDRLIGTVRDCLPLKERSASESG